MAVPVGSILLTAVSAMASVFLVFAIGFAAARYPKQSPLLSPSILSKLGSLSHWLFVPCLVISSFGRRLTPELLATTWPLLPWSLCTMLLSFCIMRATVYCLRLPDTFWQPLILVATTFTNTVGLPLLMVETLCKQEADFDLCFDTSVLSVFVYSVAWQVLYWSFGYQTLQASGTDKTAADKGSPSLQSVVRKMVVATCKTPSFVAVIIGGFIGLIAPLNYAFFDKNGAMRWLGSVIDQIGQPTVTVSALVMAGSLAHSQSRKNKAEQPPASSATPASPSSSAKVVAVAPPAAAAAAEAMKEDVEVGGRRRPSAVTVHARRPPRSVLIAFVTVRLIIIPAIGFLVIWLLLPTGIATQDATVQLVLLLQFAMPSAQSCVVSLNHLELQEQAISLAGLYFWQYASSVLTLTLWTTIAKLIVQA